MKKYLTQWNVVKILRMSLGIFITAEGFISGEWLFAVGGLVFSILSLTNTGCCSTSGCSVPVAGKKADTEKVFAEEVK